MSLAIMRKKLSKKLDMTVREMWIILLALYFAHMVRVSLSNGMKFEYMHIKEDFLAEKPGIEQDEVMAVQMGNHCNYSGGYSFSYDDDPELLTIMEREFGSKQKERDRYSSYRKQTVSTPVLHTTVIKENEPKKEYLLVDGYNIIFAWEELNELAKASIDLTRNKLMDILSNYQGFIGCTLILVFDAYKVKGNQGEVQKYHNIYVVYTKEAETADQYIEKTTHEIGRKYKVTVATSDALEQVIVMGQELTESLREISMRK